MGLWDYIVSQNSSNPCSQVVYILEGDKHTQMLNCNKESTFKNRVL